MLADLGEIEAAIGYAFNNRDLLRRALTHASHAYETDPTVVADNERLEFLGDAVLGFLTSEYLIERYPAYREGRLSIIKNYLVSATHLYEVAERLDLGRYLLLGRGEELSGGRAKKGLLADAMEALIAAVHLDGGIGAARAFAVRNVFEGGDAAEGGEAPFTNFKGALQESARALNLPSPRYSVAREDGPAHSRRFTVEVRVGDRWLAQGEGCSKKSAGQNAAQAALKQIMEESG
ncbi:MAG: ribonuclease III [Acidobacteriota bacterium]